MNAPDRIEIPAFLDRKEPAAVYMWLSTKRLIVSKGEDQIDLSADDLLGLIRFFRQFDLEGQL